MNTNPWQVDSIDAFICFKCPECQFYSQKDDFFQNHALENHPLSIVLFEKSEELLEANSGYKRKVIHKLKTFRAYWEPWGFKSCLDT